jgi:kumamolisin
MALSHLTLLLLSTMGASLPIEAKPPPPGAVLQRTSANTPASVIVNLVLSDQRALEALLVAQHSPGSPQFRRWLTPNEFGARFGLSDVDYQHVVDTFAEVGLQVTRYPSRLVLQATGTTGQLERLLHIRFYDVKSNHASFRTFQGKPSLPDAIAKQVQHLGGLDTRPRFRRRLKTGFGNALGPQDLRRFYDIASLHAAGFAGQSSRVAVIGPIPDSADMPDPNDINYFYRTVSDSSTQFQLVNLPNPNGILDTQGDKIELELDSEMSTIAAPMEQSVTMVLAPTDQMLTIGAAYVVNFQSDVTAVSTSYGNCEAQEDATEPTAVANLVAQGSAEGQAWFAAAGDNGADDCGDGSGPAVDFPASIPYIIATGGTKYTGQFDVNNAVDIWGSEVTWNDGVNGGGAGGGGVSTLFAKPSYQVGPGTSTGVMRELPDFSLHASPQPGVASVTFQAGFVDSVGGTSDSAPMAAGVFALLNDVIGGCRVGAPHFELYPLGAAQQAGGPAVFHDITQGNLNQDGVTGPSATIGYDEATGWGSLDVAVLAANWPHCPSSGSPSGPTFLPDGGLPLNDAGLYDPGAFDAGAAIDGGPRAPYDACTVLGCTSGSVCETVDAGPSACVIFCTAGSTVCPLEQFCDSTQGICVPGCQTDSNCASTEACNACDVVCQPRTDGGAIGGACTDDSQCPTFSYCFTDAQGFPGGACTQDCDPTMAACQCPTGSQCSPFGHCFATCSVSAQTGCRENYVCWDDGSGDQGECRPACTQDSDCLQAQDVCNVTSGICFNPATTNGTTASSSSASTGSSGVSSSTGTSGTSNSTGATVSASASTSNSGSTSASASTTSSGSSSGAGSTGSTTSTSGTNSTSSTSSTGSTHTTATSSSGSSTGTHGSSSIGSTGTTGSSAAKKGCGCNAGEPLDGALGMLITALTLFRRRRTKA